MVIGIPREHWPREKRIAMDPDSLKKLAHLEGLVIKVESGLGEKLYFSDEAYAEAGATVVTDRNALFAEADIVLSLKKPSHEEIEQLKKGAIHISHLDPFNDKPLIESLAARGVSAIAMEMIPRITRAQKMDALSSQASLAGYEAVIVAAERIGRVFPMMMTPAGTIPPARVFVIGVGVAGLQAIATAKRLGARVEAFDTRPTVEEQVKSLGANFVKVDLGETGQTKDGYARQLTEEQINKQREAMAKHCKLADVIITTAQVFGKKAPRIVTRPMIEAMKPGSVLVDLAVETGGNVEGAKVNETVDVNGVKIIGIANLPGEAAVDATHMYASNLTGLLEEFWDEEKKTFELDLNDEIIQGCLLTHKGKIVNKQIKDFMLKAA